MIVSQRLAFLQYLSIYEKTAKHDRTIMNIVMKLRSAVLVTVLPVSAKVVFSCGFPASPVSFDENICSSISVIEILANVCNT